MLEYCKTIYFLPAFLHSCYCGFAHFPIELLFFFLLICGNFYFNTVDINPFLVLYIANIFSQSTFPFDKTALLRYN